MYINTILRTGKNRNKVKETKKMNNTLHFRISCRLKKKHNCVIPQLGMFQTNPIFFVTVLFEKQYSTIIEHKRYKINRHVSCH